MDRRRNDSAINRDGPETILYDTPSSIGEVLNEERVFKISAVFLSHRHFDHIGGISAFEFWPGHVRVYGNMSALGSFETTDMLYNHCVFYVLHERVAVQVGGMRVVPFEVPHKVPTFGLTFQKNGQSIVHFSDMASAELDDYQAELVRKADVAVFHTPGFDGGTDHIDVRGVVAIARRHPATRFVITHIGHNNFSHDELVARLSPYDNLIVAYDRMELEV
ncbi:MAG: MBL fold metallo-hydrolase [bacterium]|nr:MBL fold metallo-hydrolase [bacterium]